MFPLHLPGLTATKTSQIHCLSSGHMKPTRKDKSVPSSLLVLPFDRGLFTGIIRIVDVAF